MAENASKIVAVTVRPWHGFRGMYIHMAARTGRVIYSRWKYMTHSDTFRFAAKCPVGPAGGLRPKGREKAKRVPRSTFSMCRLSAAFSPLPRCSRCSLLDILSRSGPLNFGPTWPEVDAGITADIVVKLCCLLLHLWRDKANVDILHSW